ncbi:MAG: hypothetical protein VX494_15485 [Actinomycetota bacterium]|nr:hypothetical protein [Actinomycetota bacterium]
MNPASKAVGALLALGLVVATAVGGWYVVREIGPGFLPDRCEATVGDLTVELTPEQAENAALIAAIGVRRGLPARAVSIALATAYQESGLRNLTTGDRDSLGLFQQRPSQGWGTKREVSDPVHSTNAFYDALVEVSGYRDLPITEAAQAVQRSAFPDAYADHEDDARALASALTGNSRGAFHCEVPGSAEAGSAELGGNGLTPRAEDVRAEAVAVFGPLSLGGFAPGGVRDGHIPGSTHYDGRAVDIFFRPINDASRTRGWAVASYLVAQAERLDIQTIIFDAKIWTARRSDEGWRKYDAPDRPGDPDILAHRDHVHVDVFS